MELILNPTLIINEFEDGDMVIIDQQKEMTHLLNKSAALIITIFKDRVNTVEKCVEIFSATQMFFCKFVRVFNLT